MRRWGSQQSFSSLDSVEREELKKDLLGPEFDHLQAVCAGIKGNALFRLTQLLLNFYRARNRDQDLLSWAVLQQIKASSNAEGLFREGSFATKVMLHVFRLDGMGTKYLDLIFRPLVQQLEAHPEIHKIGKEDENAAHNMERMFYFLGEFLERLINTVLYCPLYIREGLLYFDMAASRKFPKVQAVTSSVLFPRFLLPSLISPHQYGIWSDIPTAQEGLSLAARILQSMASRSEFPHHKCSNYEELNDFIVVMSPRIDSYRSALLDEEQIRVGRIMIDASVYFEPDPIERERTLQEVITFLEAFDITQNIPRALAMDKKSIEEMRQSVFELKGDENWKLVRVKKGGSLYSLQLDDESLLIWKFAVQVEWSCRTMYDHLWQSERFPAFFKVSGPFVSNCSIQRHSEFERDSLFELYFPYPFSKRDVLLKAYGTFREDHHPSTFIEHSTENDKFPTKPGVIRMRCPLNAIILEPVQNDKCKLTVINCNDMKGTVPLWLKNWFGMGLLDSGVNIAKYSKDHPDEKL